MDDNDEIKDYAALYDDNHARIKPRLRSLISRGSKPIKKEIYDEATGEWRTVIRMSRRKFDDRAKEVFLKEYAKWGRMGEAASAAGVTPQTIRKAMEDDEEFAEAMYIQEDEYTDKLIGHHQNLVFNGTVKTSYDRNGNIISEETVYPIRLIELELKKHDKGYREKQEIAVSHSGGVLVAPAETVNIDDWEKRFSQAKDVTPSLPLLGNDDEEDEKIADTDK